MAGAGRVDTSSSANVSLEPLEAPNPAPPIIKGAPRDWPTTTEAFSERTSSLSTPSPLGRSDDTPSLSAEQLARQTSAAQRSGNEVREALRESLRELARKHPDGEIRDAEFAFGSFEASLQSGAALKALGTLSKQDAMQAVREELKAAWPKLSADELSDLGDDVQRQIQSSLRGQSAWKMQKAAVAMMDKTSAHLRAIANDPKATAELLSQLQRLPTAEANRFKELYGLNEPSRQHAMTPEVASERLLARAKLIDTESRNVSRTGGDRIFMAVAEHDTRNAVMTSMGAAPGSWLERASASAQEAGKTQASNLAALKVATSVATAFFTGGLGLTGVASVAVASGSSMLVGAPALAQAFHHVDAARVGESAGTMAEGSVDVARSGRNLAAAGFALSAAAPVVMGAVPGVAHAVHHAERVAAAHLGDAAAAGLGHAVPHAVVEVVELKAHGERTGSAPGTTTGERLDAARRGGR
ncbi:MAG: hypothetical protein IAE78_00350 [Myxococcus sp.]|nr:hypothetical protein [Myxococcus sp.]